MKTLTRRCIGIFLMIFCFSIATAQQLELTVLTKDSLNNVVINGFKYQTFHKNEALLRNEINAIHDSLIHKGYLNIKLDSLNIKDSVYSAFFDLGKPIKNITITFNFILNKSIIKKYTLIYNDRVFTIGFKSVKPLLNDLIDDFEKNGKPFTQLRLSKIAFTDSIATAQLIISNQEQRTLSKIIIKDYENFPRPFLIHYLKLNTGDTFSASKLASLSKKINYLNFVSEIKPPEVLFTKDETTIYLYLKKIQTNSVDGLIGFTSKQNGKGLLFNGYLDLQLENAFNTGESISLLFKNDGLAQQKFNIGAKLPYLFNSRFLAMGSLEIFKQDSLYINVKTSLALNYPISFNSEVGLSISQERSSNLLSAKISNLASYQSSYFGLHYQFLNFTDDLLFNEKLHFNTNFFFGAKTVETLKTNQVKIEAEVSYLWLLNQRNALFIKNKSALLNTSNYLTNELFRLGGAKNIRGFDEERLLASAFSILNLEYRYKTNLDAYLYTVTDFGYLNNALVKQNSNLYSLGFGYKFRAKMGVINLSYVLGIANNQSFNINNSIFNFNIRSLF